MAVDDDHETPTLTGAPENPEGDDRRTLRGGQEAQRDAVPGGETTFFDVIEEADGKDGLHIEVAGYELVSELGRGGMGRVYRAVQRSLHREVALKILEPHVGDSTFHERFRREALASAQLNHPNIVRVFDHGFVDGTPYLVLEYVRGRDLHTLVDQQGALGDAAALGIVRGAASGLRRAHKLGVIHRDVKPANIVVDEAGPRDASGHRWVAKVVDFGLARLREEPGAGNADLTETGHVIGSPAFMSPEQAMGRDVDHRADIYSLGATLYYLLTGRRPFEGSTPPEVFHRKLNDDPADPRQLNPSIAEPVALIVGRMLAREPGQRFASYDELLAAIDALLTVDDTGASRELTARLAPAPAARRRRRAVAVVAALLVLITAGWGVRQLMRDESREERAAPGGPEDAGEASAGGPPPVPPEATIEEEAPPPPLEVPVPPAPAMPAAADSLDADLEKLASALARADYEAMKPILEHAEGLAMKTGRRQDEELVRYRAVVWAAVVEGAGARERRR